jgi:hypothetical protein
MTKLDKLFEFRRAEHEARLREYLLNELKLLATVKDSLPLAARSAVVVREIELLVELKIMK